MKVKELVAVLSAVDPDLEVYGYTEDEAIASGKHLFRIFHVEGVDVSSAETFRDANHAPSIKFVRSEKSREIAFINLTTDF